MIDGLNNGSNRSAPVRCSFLLPGRQTSGLAVWRPPRGIVGVCAASWREPQPQMCCLVYHFRSATFLPGPLLRNFPCAPSIGFFFLSSLLSLLLRVLPPTLLLFCFPKKPTRFAVGRCRYDLRAGCDVRRGSQRCVGRGARGAVPGMDWAWSWACRTDTVSGCGWAVLIGQTDGRTDGREGGQICPSVV